MKSIVSSLLILIAVVSVSDISFASSADKCLTLFNRPTVRQSALSNKVLNYYTLIDAYRTPEGATSEPALDQILEMFTPGASYVRDEATYQGRDQISHFFKNVRALTGAHFLTSIEVSGTTVNVIGYFVGANNGVLIGEKLYFKDYWFFDPATNLVVQRKSTLSMPGL